MSIEVNGVTLPDIPSEVLAQYPYAVVFSVSNGDTLIAMKYYLISGPFVGMDYTSETGIYPYVVERALVEGTISNASPMWRYTYGTENTDSWTWTDQGLGNTNEISELVLECADVGYVLEIAGASHDIMLVDPTTYAITDTVYFAANFSVSDPNYYAPKSWYDGMARQVMRLTGTSDKLTTDEMLAGLKDYEGGITLGPYDSIMYGTIGTSTLDLSGLLTSSAS